MEANKAQIVLNRVKEKAKSANRGDDAQVNEKIGVY
jgi:hypothetical protein